MDEFFNGCYRYIDAAKIAVNAVFGDWKGTAGSVGTAYLHEKERSKKAFAEAHADWSNEQKAKFNEAWINRPATGPAGPHVPGSPRVFDGV